MLLLTSTKFVLAQSFKAETSELFNSDIGFPVLVMEDGTTIFQYDNVKERKMFLTIFDKNHNIIVNKKEPNFKKINYVYHFSYQQSTHAILWIENKGKAVVYMENNLKPFYVVINPKTGNVEEETEMENVSVAYTTMVNARTIEHRHVSVGSIDLVTGNRMDLENKFNVFKSAKEAYTLKDFSGMCTFNLSFYNSAGKLLQKPQFDLLKDYTGIVVLSKKYHNDVLYMVSKLLQYNTLKEYQDVYQGINEKGAIYYSTYDLKTNKFNHVKICDINEADKFNGCKMFIDKEYKNILLQFTASIGSTSGAFKQTKNYFQVFYLPIDTQTGKLGKAFNLPSDKLDTFVKENCNEPNGYNGGMINSSNIDTKGNIFLTRVKNVVSINGYSTVKNPELIGISSISPSGKENYSVAYPYNVFSIDPNTDSYGPPPLNTKSFNYTIGLGSKSNFLFLNNLSENFNSPLNKKPILAKAVEECNAFAIEITESGELKQHYLFGEPSNKKENKYADFRITYFDEKTKTIVVKIFEGPGYKNTRAAWIKLE